MLSWLVDSDPNSRIDADDVCVPIVGFKCTCDLLTKHSKFVFTSASSTPVPCVDALSRAQESEDAPENGTSAG